MKIKTVEYRRLVTHGSYENTTIGATAEVKEGQSPIDALDSLKEWVEVEIGVKVGTRDHVIDEERRLTSLQQQVADREAYVGRLVDKADELREILKAHGVEMENYSAFSMPF